MEAPVQYPGVGGPVGERTWDSGAMGPLYDTSQHTGGKMNHPAELWGGYWHERLMYVLYGEYWDYPEYMRPINGEWC